MSQKKRSRELHKKKFGKEVSFGTHAEDEYNMMLKQDEKEKARKRTRGPYRKASKAGL